MEIVHYPVTNPFVGTMICRSCRHSVRAWRSGGMSECWPHFYCDLCSNVIHREADKDAAWEEQSLESVERIAETLPDCPCGGRFRPGANPKCPVCKTEFAHQNDVVKRLTDPHMIIQEGACAFSDRREPYQVAIDEA